MKQKQFRFKRELYSINGVNNIPILIICNGHGYDLKTVCCKNCGEIFVIDNEYLSHKKVILSEIIKTQNCPKCNISLINSLINYPENIYLMENYI